MKNKYTHSFMKLGFLFVWASFLIACNTKQNAQFMVLGNVLSVGDSLQAHEAFVVQDGKVAALGSAQDLLKKYKVDSTLNFAGKYIYPGLIDAHCHFYGLGMFAQRVDLSNSKSFEEVVKRCQDFAGTQTRTCLLGRGWDQTKWEGNEFPTNQLLNEAFPNYPVVLKRVDGHAAIANDVALQMAKLTVRSKIAGGSLLQQNGKLSGVLIDNAVDLVEAILPKPSREENIEALLTAQKMCLAHGITALTDAGLDTDIIWLIDSLQQAGLLRIKINAMVSLTDENLAYWLNRGPFYSDLLQVNSFKMYGDGALGSRGACLLKHYEDKPNEQGFLLTQLAAMEKYVRKIAASPFQLNTHAIGDSTNRILLKLYASALAGKPDRRWRIEHAQVVNEADFPLFGSGQVVPSVQPTHATSDMYWAEARLGSDRLKGAYAYKTLLQQLGWLPLGTDFPVEQVSPFYTFFAAVARTDAAGFPAGGFQIQEGLSREEALKGITFWAAKGAFQEKQMGTLQVGSAADFVVVNHSFLTAELLTIRNQKPLFTFINASVQK
ncbi:MAG: amidohydrolase [Bacteroidota bacterium]|nr:amidohydrolase [Bacteroidota bacterium]